MFPNHTINTHFLKDRVNGPRYIEFGFSNLRLYIVPRIDLDFADSMEQLETPCLYVLSGMKDGERCVYIGQSISFSQRVIYHDDNKEFWDTAYVFVSKNKGDLTSADVEYLEYITCRDAKSIGRIPLLNSQGPSVKILEDSRYNVVEKIYDEIKLLLKYTSIDLFSKFKVTESKLFHLNEKDANATGFYDTESLEFVVRKGSKISLSPAPKYTGKLKRSALIEEITKKDRCTIKKDYRFSSPSAAASFVLGRSSNGWADWKDNNDKPLADIKL